VKKTCDVYCLKCHFEKVKKKSLQHNHHIVLGNEIEGKRTTYTVRYLLLISRVYISTRCVCVFGRLGLWAHMISQLYLNTHILKKTDTTVILL